MLLETLLVKAELDGFHFDPTTQPLIAFCSSLDDPEPTSTTLTSRWLDAFRSNPVNGYPAPLQARLEMCDNVRDFMEFGSQVAWGADACIRSLPLGLVGSPDRFRELALSQAKVTHAEDSHLCAPAYAMATYLVGSLDTTKDLGGRINLFNPGYAYDEPWTGMPSPEPWAVLRCALTYLELCGSQMELMRAIEGLGGVAATRTACVAVWLSTMLTGYTKDAIVKLRNSLEFDSIVQNYLEIDKKLTARAAKLCI